MSTKSKGNDTDLDGVEFSPEEVIELTDPIRATAGSEADDESLSLETEALVQEEEAEIIELVDSVEHELSDDEIIELEDMVEEVELDESVGIEMPTDGPSIPGADEVVEDLDFSVEPEESVAEEMPIEDVETAPDIAALEGFSEERIEEIVTRVVTEVIEKKADRILVEVAEAAVQKEIEKIKKLL